MNNLKVKILAVSYRLRLYASTYFYW